MKELISALTIEFEKNANEKIAFEQKAYMRNQFEFYGIKTTLRREIQKPFFIKEFLPPKDQLTKMVKILWEKPERDYHHFAQELVFKYLKKLEEKDIELFEYMITHKSWWDTADFIAVKLIGAYFKKYSEYRHDYIKKWLATDNIWLQRSALLFQLKDKENIDPLLLSETIHSLLGSKEFFINKAIGWVLREYSRTNPGWVIQFAEKTALSTLSKRESLRLIK